MTEKLSSLLLAAAVALSPLVAQAQTTTEEAPAAEAEAEAPAETETGSDPTGFSTGQIVDTQRGTIYTREEFTDWLMRCVRIEDGVQTDKDPCQLYQLLQDEQGNSVAEISIVGLPEAQGGAVAGATIIVPLETLLTQQLTLRIDGGAAKRYPFNWCTQIGCFSRVGFTGDEIAGFKRGNKGQITIVPVAAPEQRVQLSVSLSGFTAGYDAVIAHNKALDAQQ